jgi:dTDP-4-dehydrorhamnose 3,5-epimerase
VQATPTGLSEVILLKLDVFHDDRGSFFELYRQDKYREFGIDAAFVQDNRSCSHLGVLRGLHYQEPMAQGKLVQVLRGSIFDVVVDIRRGSPDFGRWVSVELKADRFEQLWVPAGFAHGFLALSDQTEVIYKCTEIYSAQHEHTLLWNDSAIGIEWPALGVPPRLSAKDRAGRRLAELDPLPAYIPRRK